MERKNKQLLAWLMTLVMCFATLAPTTVFAEDTNDGTSRIVTMEDFSSGSINTSSKVADVSANGGFWFDDSREGGTYSLENETLWYTCRRGQLIDIRFYHDTDAQRELLSKVEGQDFILSFQLKAHHDAISMKSTFTEHYTVDGTVKTATYSGISIGDGTINTPHIKVLTDGYQTKSNLDYEIYRDQWYLIEYAFEYDENAVSAASGKQGAYTKIYILFNGEIIDTVTLTASQYLHVVDHIRLGQDSVDECEIDNLTVATGLETLSGVDGRTFDSYTKRVHWIQPADKTPAEDYAYSFAVVGDTQKVSRIDAIEIKSGGVGGRMDKIYDWIVDNVDEKKIEYVLGLGDITEYGYGETLPGGNEYSQIEWENAVKTISQMNGVVPYSIVRGNHDGLSNGINKYFTDNYKNQFTANTDAAGFFGNQGVANSYRAVKIGQTDYLFITLNYNPTDAVLEEAGTIIEQYPNHRVVITTHAYMYDNYTTISSEDYFSGYANNDGEGIWNKLIRKYENIFLVMSGHIGSDLVQVSQVEGDHGNVVTQMLIDFQVTDADFGYTGMVVMLYFSEDGQQIEVETYSPLHNAYFLEENQFTFKIDPNSIYSNDFNSCTTEDIPTSVGGTVILGVENVTRSIENGALKITKTADSGNISLRFYQGNADYKDAGATPIKGDTVLSFKIKVENNTDDLGYFYYGNDKGMMDWPLLHVKNGTIMGFGKDTALNLNEWNEVQLVFNYDSSNSVYGSYTVVLNGEELNTRQIPTDYAATSISSFRMFRWGGSDGTVAIDNLYFGFGIGSRGKGNATELWGADFEGVTTLPTTANESTDYVRVLNAYKPDYTSGGVAYPGASKVENGILVLRGGGKQAFVDAKFGYDLSHVGDMTLSMKIKPYGYFDGNAMANMNGAKTASGDTVQVPLLSTVKNSNTIKLGTGSVELSTYRFSTVEVMFHYDYANMIYSSIDLYVNGEIIGTQDITSYNCASLGYFRIFNSYAKNGVDVEELSIVKGSNSTHTEVKTEFIGYQTTAIEDNAFNLRLISIMTDSDLSKYDYVGYNVTASFQYNGETVEMVLPDDLSRCNKVFTSVLATDEMAVAETITAATLGGQYIFAVNCIGVPADCGEIEFSVSTYYKLVGQDIVNEKTMVFTVDPTTNANQGGVN